MRCPVKAVVARPRRAMAAAELAVILPVLVFLFVFAVDFGRMFYTEFIVINAARCGALYGSASPSRAQDTAGIAQRARAEAVNLDAASLQVVSATGTDSAGNPCLDVTVTAPFHMVTGYLITRNFEVACRVRMRVNPAVPATN